MSTAIKCFIVCIFLNSLIPAVSILILAIASILLAIIFFHIPNKLFLFTLFSFCTSEMFSGSLFGLEFDISATTQGMSTISSICILSLFIIIVIKKVFSSKINVIYIEHSNPIIRCIILFTITQFLATILSVDISLSLNKFYSLIQHLLWFYVCIVFLHKIKVIELVNFVGGIAIICGTFYIYNFLILGQPYQDDANIVVLLPFLINIIWSNKLKIFSNIYFIFIGVSIFLVDSRRMLIALIIYYNNFLYRYFLKKSNYFLIISGITLLLFLLKDNSSANSPDIRIFSTIDILLKYVSGQELDNSDKYNLFTKRNILAAIGFNLFLESPIFGTGLGMNSILAGQVYFGDFTTNRFRIHNLYLEILAESGVLGFISYFMIIIVSLLAMYRSMKIKNIESTFITASVILFDVIIAMSIIAIFGSRGPYSKLTWFIFAFTYFISIKSSKHSTISH
jgi:putative inorganic carbon (hco3(-)) transporter